MSTGNRLVLASALGSLSGVAVVAVSIALFGLSQGRPAGVPLSYTLFHVFFFVALFGWPLAFGLMFALGPPLRRLLEGRIGPHLVGRVFTGLSATVGGILVAAVWAGFWGGSDQVLVWVLVGMIAGGTAGLVFLRIAAHEFPRGATP